MNEAQVRKQFEVEMLRRYKGSRTGGAGMLRRDPSGAQNYQRVDIQWRWEIWQAANQAAAGQMKPLVEALERIKVRCFQWVKFRGRGDEWQWDCDTPEDVKQCYEDADEALAAIERESKR